jgi:hypothetical protein
MQFRAHAKFVAVSVSVALTAFLVGAGATSASATTPEHLGLAWESHLSHLTLPATDNFDDSIELDVTSNRAGTVSETSHRLSGTGTFLPSGSYQLSGSGASWTTSIVLSDDETTAGVWQLKFALNGVTEKKTVGIGSGIAKSVRATLPATPVFSNNDQAAHYLHPQIVATDEIGTSLPITAGTVTYTDSKGKNPRTSTFESSSPTSSGVTLTDTNDLDVEGTNPGVGTLKVSGVQGPVASTHPAKSTSHPRVSVAKLTSLKLSFDYPVLYPNATTTMVPDGINMSIGNNVGHILSLVNSSVTISKGSTSVASWPLVETGIPGEDWNGFDGSSVVAGTYTVTVKATLPEGNTLIKTAHLVVSAAIPVEKTLTVTFPGNDFGKQYLHGDAKCKAKGSSLDCVSTTGHGDVGSIVESVPKSVLGLAKPLGYSTAIAVDANNYSSTGGSAFYIWGDKFSEYGSTVNITGNGTFGDGPVAADHEGKLTSLQFTVEDGINLDLSKFTVTYTYWALPK